MSEDPTEIAQPLTNQWFATTHWTVVLTAQGSPSPAAVEALEHLCRNYWGALYAYVRRSGRAPADAADLTQAFFARFLEKEFLKDVDRNKGKFRSFLLKTLNHFLADDWRHAHAQKRGGSQPRLSINTEEWETRFGGELATQATPESAFDRRWALALFDRALEKLRNESVQVGKKREFELLKEFLSRPSQDGAYSTIAEQLGLDESVVAVRVHRLRRRYGQLVREEVAQTVAHPDEVEDELRHLLTILSS